MAFVYQYRDINNDVVYVGIVKGHSIDKLFTRIYGHRNDYWQEAGPFNIYYATVAAPADADIYETIMIGKYQPKYNSAKSSWGESSFSESLDSLEFYPLPDMMPKVQIRELKKPDYMLCSICRKKLSIRSKNNLNISFSGPKINYYLDQTLCPKCSPNVIPLLDQIFDIGRPDFNGPDVMEV